jgi:penicillin-binding protein 1A
MAITKVVLPNGKTDNDAGWGKPARKRVIPEGVAYVVTKILEENVLYGTGTAANIGRPAAGKTGTTDNHADAWFVGYTPTLDAAVWVGYPQGEIPMTDVHGISVSGGSFPAQIWHAFMDPALASVPKQDWTEPKQLPTWRPFVRGKYALSGVPSYLLPPPSPTTTFDQTPPSGGPPAGQH